MNILSGITKFSIILVVTGFPILSIAATNNKMRINYDGYAQYNDISGNSPTSSNLTKGWIHYNLFSLYTKGKYEDFDYRLNLSLKLTNDRKKDIQGISLVNLAGQLKNKQHTLDMGDFFKSYSKYSLNSSLKGISYTYKSEEQDMVNVSYGLAYPRWDSFWDNEVDSTERKVLGLRYNKQVSEELSIGADLVTTKDKNSQVANLPLYDTTLYTLNTTYKPIRGLKIYGEYSFSQNETRNGSTFTKKDGSAFFLQAIGNKQPSRVQLEYERISPNFKTVTGSATKDREKAKATWRYNITKLTTINSGFLWFRDNLDSTKAATTHTYRPNLGVTFKRPFERRYAVVDLNSKLNIIDTPTNKTYDKMYDLNYRDRYGIVYSDMSLAYNNYDTKNSRDQNELRFNSTFNTRHSYKNVVIKPSWSYGTWNMNDELTNNQNSRYHQNTFGLGLDIPKHRVSSKLRIGENKSSRDSGDDLEKFFGAFDLYWRAGNVESFKNVMVYAKASVNDFSYTTSTSNYQEKSFTLGVKMSF